MVNSNIHDTSSSLSSAVDIMSVDTLSLEGGGQSVTTTCHLAVTFHSPPVSSRPSGKARRKQQWEPPAASPASGQPAPLQPVALPLAFGQLGFPAAVLPASLPAHLLPAVQRPVLPPRRPLQHQLHTPVAVVEPAAAVARQTGPGWARRTREERPGESDPGPGGRLVRGEEGRVPPAGAAAPERAQHRPVSHWRQHGHARHGARTGGGSGE